MIDNKYRSSNYNKFDQKTNQITKNDNRLQRNVTELTGMGLFSTSFIGLGVAVGFLCGNVPGAIVGGLAGLALSTLFLLPAFLIGLDTLVALKDRKVSTSTAEKGNEKNVETSEELKLVETSKDNNNVTETSYPKVSKAEKKPKEYNWGFQKGMEVIADVSDEKMRKEYEGMSAFAKSSTKAKEEYTKILNPSDHGHNCGLISINYALISEFQKISSKEERNAFIDQYKTFLLKGLDSAAEKDNKEQQEAYSARYNSINKGAALMLDYLDHIQQDPSSALVRFEKLIAGEENSLAVFALTRNAIAHQVKMELNGNDFSEDFSLSKEDLSDLMSIKEGAFNKDIHPCLTTAVMGAFLKGLNFKMDCVTEHGLQKLGSQNEKRNTMNMDNYVLFLDTKKSHFFLLNKESKKQN